MWHHGCIPDEEGLLLLLGCVHEVKDGLHALAPDAEALITVAACIHGHAAGEAHVLISDVPKLAGLEGEIAGVGEGFGQDQRVTKQLVLQFIA
jgi:hypothetical protein